MTVKKWFTEIRAFKFLYCRLKNGLTFFLESLFVFGLILNRNSYKLTDSLDFRDSGEDRNVRYHQKRQQAI